MTLNLNTRPNYVNPNYRYDGLPFQQPGQPEIESPVTPEKEITTRMPPREIPPIDYTHTPISAFQNRSFYLPVGLHDTATVRLNMAVGINSDTAANLISGQEVTLPARSQVEMNITLPNGYTFRMMVNGGGSRISLNNIIRDCVNQGVRNKSDAERVIDRIFSNPQNRLNRPTITNVTGRRT